MAQNDMIYLEPEKTRKNFRDIKQIFEWVTIINVDKHIIG